MNLLSSLNAGLLGAANGHAEIYIRGTSTRATIYEDFEGTQPDSTGDNIPLDAYGSAEVYVNQLVDVMVKDADGVLVREYTDGYSAPNIEVVSPAFTGNDYVSGAAAVNEPTTLQAVLDLWETNAGSPDWKVSIGGSDTTLTNAFGATTGLVYNVKSPQFGAVGNGIANDTAAISAAVLAAGTAGGGVVFFPRGTYLITSAISLDNTVSMVGSGARGAIITINSATEKVFQLTSAVSTDASFLIQGLTFQASQVNSGSMLYIGASTAKLVLSDCVIGGNSLSIGYGLEYNANCRIQIERCWFNINGGSFGAVRGGASATGSHVRIHDCTVVGPAAFTGYFLDLRATFRAWVSGCTFDAFTNSTSGSYSIVNTTNSSTITGNNFYGATIPAAISYINGTVAIARDNIFVGVTERYLTTALLSNGSFLELEQRGTVASTTTPIIPNGVEMCQFTSATTVPTWTFPTKFYVGQQLLLMISNSSGFGWGAMSFPFSTATSNIGYPSISNGGTAAIQFVVSDRADVNGDWYGIWATG